MQALSERFEMRLDPGSIERVDRWRSSQPDLPSRAEAIRRLANFALRALDSSDRVEISDGEKLLLMMLSEVHRHLGIEDGLEPDFIERAITGGHHWAMAWKYPGIFHRMADDVPPIREVVEILTMWSLIETAYDKLSQKNKDLVETEAAPFGEHVFFRGFDGSLEVDHLRVAQVLIDDLDRFEAFKGRGLNSHAPTVEVYRRMLVPFREMRQGLAGIGLNMSQIIALLKAMVHPS
ncbi:MAG: YfbU family protein [Alphaproteobacteria bacterium]|nr:YfbU family protein [Alphaproteobacteria bacterium]